MSTDVVSIVLLSTLAGLGTGLGGLVVLVRKPGEKLFVFLIGLAAGLMIMLSFIELLSDSRALMRVNQTFPCLHIDLSLQRSRLKINEMLKIYS